MATSELRRSDRWKVTSSAIKSHFHYFVRYSDGGKRKRQEDDKLIGTDSSNDHYFVRCYSTSGKSYFVSYF